MIKPIPAMDSWLNSDLFRPPILAFMPKLIILWPPKNLLKTRFQGNLNMAIFDLQTGVGGLNRSEFNQEYISGSVLSLNEYKKVFAIFLFWPDYLAK